MTVYGDGKQTRSFQYVSDLVGIPRLFAKLFMFVSVSVFFFELHQAYFGLGSIFRAKF